MTVVVDSSRRPSRWHGDLAASIALMVAAAVVFLDVLQFGLTGIDAYPTIAAGRADTIADVGRVLLRELRGGIEPTIAYYRPLTLLTYTFDYALWGWDPFGYHLTDLLLHGTAVGTVYWLARLAFGQGMLAASGVALVFLLHPSALELVPAVTRRQEPLMVIGMSLAVIGAKFAPSPRGWAGVLIGSLVAVCAAERALVVPAFVFAYVVCMSGQGLFRERVRQAARISLPSFAVALGFFVLRNVLVGGGALNFRPANLLRLPPLAALQLLYPQQLVDISQPGSMFGLALLGLAGFAAVASGVWLLRSSAERALHQYALASTTAYVAAFVVAGQTNPWYSYTAAPALGLTLVALAREGVQTLGYAPAARWRGLLHLGAAGSIVTAFAVHSPLVQDYPAWRRSAAMAEQVWEFLLEQDRALPPDVAIVLVNVPMEYQESAANAGVTFSATVLMQHAVDAWRAVRGVERVVVLAGLSHQVDAVAAPQVQFTDSATARIYFPPGDARWYDAARPLAAKPVPAAVGRGVDLPWPPVPPGTRFVSFMFDSAGFTPLPARDASASE